MKLTAGQLQDYEANGYLVLKQVLPAKERKPLLEECMASWKAVKGPFDSNATWLKNALLTDIHHRSERVCRYYFNGPLVDVATQLIGPNIKGATSQLTFKLRGNTMPFGWHQDNGYGQLEPANAISTLTALDDADEENGCLWVIPGSHRDGQVDVSNRLNPQSKATGADLSVDVEHPGRAVPVPLTAGDAVVLHCHQLHRSEGNRSLDRDRRILFLRYADADAVEVYNDRKPRLGPLLRGVTRFPEVASFEQERINQQSTEPL